MNKRAQQTSIEARERAPEFVTTKEAAVALATTEPALREKIRRVRRRIEGREVADLGVVKFYKFGRNWRGRWADLDTGANAGTVVA